MEKMQENGEDASLKYERLEVHREDDLLSFPKIKYRTYYNEQ